MKIGTVVLNYNDWATTTKYVNHVSGMDVDKIVIVDNCSGDDSVIHLKDLENDKIKLLVADRNGGYSVGNNIGMKYLIEEERTDLIIVSNPDIIYNQDFIDEAKKFLLDNDDLMSVTGVMKYPNGSYDKHPFLPFISFTETIFSFIIPISLLFIRPFNKKKYKLNRDVDLQLVDSLPGCLFMIKSSFVKDVGYFDEGTFLYYEEAILGRQIQASGGRCGIMTKVEYIHDHAKTIGKHYNNVNKIRLFNESGYYYYTHYCNLSGFQRWLYRVFSWLNVEQYKIINFVRNLNSRRNGLHL